MSDLLTPRQRWGTCCPFDPACEHSFMDENELEAWLDTPIDHATACDVIGESTP